MKLNEIVDTNQYFDTTTTGMSTPDEILVGSEYDKEYHRKNKGVEGEIVWMSPKEYFQACSEGFRSIGGTGDVASGLREDDIVKYMGMMKDGVKFHFPTLDYRNGFTQEGRNRIEAARRLGATQVPVGIIRRVKED